MLEPFFAPCAAPVPAVKLVSLLGYCKYSLYGTADFGASLPRTGGTYGVLSSGITVGSGPYLLGHPKFPDPRRWFGATIFSKKGNGPSIPMDAIPAVDQLEP